jgi:molybdopterin-guanine dinucleotide biosynthesis protein A
MLDGYLGIGPLGGLLSAQQRFPDASWLVTACDLPFLDHSLLGELVVERNPFSFATAYRHAGSKPEPLCTLYEPKSRLPLLLRHATGNNSLRSFLEDSSIHYLSVKDPRYLHNINTPEERKQVIKSLSTRGKRQ